MATLTVPLTTRRHASPRSRVIPPLVRYFPIIFFQAFMTLTVLIFAFGPWDWPVDNPLQLYSFIVINQVALLIGYLLAVSEAEPAHFSFPVSIKKMVGICAATSILILPALTFHRTGGLIDFSMAILQPGAAYNATREAALVGTYSVVEYVGIILSPLVWPLLALTVTFWKRLSLPIRVAAIAGIVMSSFSYLLIGTNKGNADILSLTPWFLMLGSDSPERILTSRKTLRFFGVLAVAALVFIPYFGNNIMTRAATGNLPSIGTVQGRIHAEPVQIPGLTGSLADTYNFGLQELAAYVGQGYYGLSLALKEPFVWTYGVGHSRFFTWLAEKFTSQTPGAIRDETYPLRVQYDFGWDADKQWSSLYPWLASDVSFFGVPVVMFLLGRLFALTWLDSLAGNPTAVVVFGLLLVTFYYISANSQIFQDSGTVCVFWVYLIWWWISRRPAINYGVGRGTPGVRRLRSAW
jgi:hypothetical protein